MRPMLYAGAALMISASIYGFIDYKKSSHKKEFSGMYKEANLGVAHRPSQDIGTGDKTGKDNLESKREATKDITTVTSNDSKITDKKTEIKKKRSFRFSEFSRAPLKEDEEKIVIDEQETKSPDSIKTPSNKKH